MQQYHAHRAENTVNHSPADESILLRELLDSMDEGVGLLDSKYRLIYCNSAFNRLLEGGNQASLGRKVYWEKHLEPRQLREIHQQLVKTGCWQGVFPNFGGGVKAVVSMLDFPISDSNNAASKACFMLKVSDQPDVLRAHQEVQAVNDPAEKSDKTKSDFLSHVSHELRTPLNAIIGFTQLLQIGPDLSNEQEDHLTEIMSASEYLLKLINEILDLSRIEQKNGELKLFSESINTGNLFSECTSVVKALADKSAVQLLQPGPCASLVKDRVRLKQILLNLLSNAIKYNHRGGQVLIQSFIVDDNTIRIEVQDSGKGIPAPLLSTIFNPFERLTVKGMQIEGSGIGLMITRRLVNLMNGKINVLSEPGSGSVFSLDFPADTTLFDEEGTQLSSQTRRIFWIGANSSTQQYARRLTGLRPNLEFYQLEDIDSAIELSASHTPDLIFLCVEDCFSQLEQPSATAEELLKKISTIVVIDSGDSLYERLNTNLEFSDSLPMPLNTIKFMEIIDRKLCR